MTDQFTRLARDRLQQLASTLVTLRERVREAVASEMGKAVGEALRDLLTAILNRNTSRMPSPPVHPTAPPPPASSTRWDDDDDEYFDDHAAEPTLPKPHRGPVPQPPVDAVRLGFGLARWLLQRRVPILAGLGVGLAVGLATLSSHPIVQTGLAVIAAATELAAITEFAANSP